MYTCRHGNSSASKSVKFLFKSCDPHHTVSSSPCTSNPCMASLSIFVLRIIKKYCFINNIVLFNYIHLETGWDLARIQACPKRKKEKSEDYHY